MDRIVAFLFGTIVGSFLSVLSDRLPRHEQVVWGRSYCDHCKKLLRWYELVPIASYLVQGGRCRRCKGKLSFQYPVVECMTGIGFVLITQKFLPPLVSLCVMVLFCSLLVITVSDMKYKIIPDSMVVSGIVAAGFLLLINNSSTYALYFVSALGAAAFFLILWMATRGCGVGVGDVKLAFLLGLWLGFPYIVIALYLAFLTGATTGVTLILAQ